MLELSETHKPYVTSVYLDGKIYDTLTTKPNANPKGGNSTKIVKMDHYVVVDGEGDYLGEFTPQNGSGKDISEGLQTFLTDRVRGSNSLYHTV